MSPQDAINALKSKAETSETVIQTEDAQTKTVPFKDIIAYESVQGTSNGLQVFSEGGSLGKSGFASEEVLLLNLDRYLLIILM